MPNGKWPIWAFGNHDHPRIGDKIGATHVNALNVLLLLLPGTPVTFQGEELGMLGQHVSFEETQDTFCKRFGPERYQEFSRDPARGPMLWNAAENAGFCPTGVKPWLPPHKDYLEMNAEYQAESKGVSPLKLYRELALLRKMPQFQYGTIEPSHTTGNIYTFIRRCMPSQVNYNDWVSEDEQLPNYRYHVVVNVGQQMECLDNPATVLLGNDHYLPPSLSSPIHQPRVVLHTNNLRPDQVAALASFPYGALNVHPGQAFVIRSVQPGEEAGRYY